MKTTGQLFRETEKLISGQTESTGISLIKLQDLRRVFSDSVLCVGRMGDNPVESWKRQIQWYSDNNYFSELNRIDGQHMEFEWKIFPGFTTVGILNQIQRMMGELQCEPENFTGRILFMSMYNDSVWDAKGNDELCENNSKTIKKYAERFLRGHWSFLGPGSENKLYGTYDCKPDGSWNRTAEKIMQNFAGSGHPIFRCTNALERGELRSKAGGKTSIHFNGSTQNIELLLQMVISFNQLSLYGAAADMIEELLIGQKATGKPAAPGQNFFHNVLSQKCKPMKSDRETCCKNTSNDLRICQRTRSYPDYQEQRKHTNINFLAARDL